MDARGGIVAWIAAASLYAAAAPPALAPQPFVSGLAGPTEIAQPDDATGRLFITEIAGTIRIVRGGRLLARPYLDLRGTVITGGERGLLGLAFDPAFRDNGRFYVYYTRALPADAAGSEIVIERYTQSRADPDMADPASASLVLTVSHPGANNHNGGKIAFGPDGYLYAGVGDGGGGGDPFRTAQSLTELRGKILRLDVGGNAGYTIPSTNPFAGAGGATRQEIWDYGLRNPWRFSFDRATGDLIIGDVGQDLWEEVDFEPRAGGGGRNYGWSVFEGTHCFAPARGCSLSNHTLPVIEYPHEAAGASIIGGYRYRGHTLPALAGHYVYGDFVLGRIWAASPDGAGKWTATQVATGGNLTTFGEDASSELYVADTSGTVWRLTPAADTLPRPVNMSTRGFVGTEGDVLIGGFIVAGNGGKTVVVTVAGPSLSSFGIADPLADPTLTLVRQSDGAVLAANDDWGDASNASRIQAAGLAPASAREPAIMMTLPPGAYTAIASGAGGGTGTALVAAYEVDHPEVPLINVSTRGKVLGGDNVMIGGFVIQGDAPQRLVVQGAGPSLARFGIAGALADPTLTLVRQSDGAVIAANDDWRDASNAAQIEEAGFAPSDPRESAILVTLPAGAYTAIMSGANGTTGVGLVAVYAVD